MKLKEKKIYDLRELSEEQRKEIYKTSGFSEETSNHFKYLFFGTNWSLALKLPKDLTGKLFQNAKELFYTLENVQVDTTELTDIEKEKLEKVFGKFRYIRRAYTRIYPYIVFNSKDVDKDYNEITYEKFMELFGEKEEKEYEEVEFFMEGSDTPLFTQRVVEEKPILTEKQKEEDILKYNGIDVVKIEPSTERLLDDKCVINPQKHYNNENGSLYKLAEELGLNHWEFDILKRLVRCRKKGQFKQDLQKIKDTTDIYLREYNYEK